MGLILWILITALVIIAFTLFLCIVSLFSPFLFVYFEDELNPVISKYNIKRVD